MGVSGSVAEAMKHAGPVKPFQEWRANAQEAMAWLGKEDERQKER